MPKQRFEHSTDVLKTAEGTRSSIKRPRRVQSHRDASLCRGLMPQDYAMTGFLCAWMKSHDSIRVGCFGWMQRWWFSSRNS